MWPDNDTNIDFLNFAGVADIAAEIIVQANDRPISIGVSGAWGVGKSSMIRLIRQALERRDEKGDAKKKYVFVEFNAWLYQGYDDVRAALLEIIATALKSEAEARQSAIGKATELLSRVDWLRVAKLTAGSAAAFAFGLPPVGLLGDFFRYGKSPFTRKADKDSFENVGESIEEAGSEWKDLIREKADSTPPKEIHAIRECFEDTLEELGVTLIVLIDDLDRCLPETTITTLEAIRLFLFLKHTAFVIAADNAIIKHAVRKHFDGIEDSHLTSYFDKLIQVPIGVPPMGTQEVRAYMMLLYVETSALSAEQKEIVRAKVCAQLGRSWEGKRVDRAFMTTLGVEFPPDLLNRFDAADRLAPLMASASQIEGNPRLVKRFLNALSIRATIAKAHGISVDETVLAKLLLFERCGNPAAFKEFVRRINQDKDGKPRFLAAWEAATLKGDEVSLEPPWEEPFFREWLAVQPALADKDLRGAIYVSREHAPLVTPEDRLSSEGSSLLTALLEHPEMGGELKSRLAALQRPERTIILDRLLARSQEIQEWGVPKELDACLAVTRADPAQGSRLAGFLEQRPATQITPALIAKISDEPWAKNLFAKWENSPVAMPVKKSIKKVSNGNV